MRSDLRSQVGPANAANPLRFAAGLGLQPGVWTSRFAAAFVLVLAIATPTPVFAQEQEPPAVPVIRGDLGPCTADFTVTDAEGKPLFDAKIHVLIRYGFMGKRKSELEVGTNSDGRARFEGLPNRAKKPLEFRIRSTDAVQLLVHDPEADCNPSFTVKLEQP
jgi:hypothetical protein